MSQSSATANSYHEIFLDEQSESYVYYDDFRARKAKPSEYTVWSCDLCQKVIHRLIEDFHPTEPYSLEYHLALQSFSCISPNLTKEDARLFSRVKCYEGLGIIQCKNCKFYIVRDPGVVKGWFKTSTLDYTYKIRLANVEKRIYKNALYEYFLNPSEVVLSNKELQLGTFWFSSTEDLCAYYLLYYLCERDGFIRWPSRLSTIVSPVNFDQIVKGLILHELCVATPGQIELICTNMDGCVCGENQHVHKDLISFHYKMWKKKQVELYGIDFKVPGYDIDFPSLPDIPEEKSGMILVLPTVDRLSRTVDYDFPKQCWSKLVMALTHINSDERRRLSMKGDLWLKIYSLQAVENRKLSVADHQSNVSKYQSNSHMASQMRRLGLASLLQQSTLTSFGLNDKSLADAFEAIIGACVDEIGLIGLDDLNHRMNFSGFRL